MVLRRHPVTGLRILFLKDEIMYALNSTKDKDFILAISVQGHGRYPETDPR